MAALGVAGATALQAQVYSVNAVGYINVEVKTGFNLLANQLIPADATVAAILAGVPGGTIIYKFDPATGYDINSYDADFGIWENPDMTLNPGEGFWLRSPSDFTITFVGEVPQGSLTTPLAEGFNLVSSQVPQAGLVGTDLGMPVTGGDTVYQFDPASGYHISSFDADFGIWDNGEPDVAVGEGFWVRKAAAADWTRDFSVN
jgi:hypothetical protein